MPTIATQTRAAEFRETLDKRVLVADGAMGTALYAKGVFINRCYDELNLSLPGAGARRPPGIRQGRRGDPRDQYLRRESQAPGGFRIRAKKYA